MSDDKQDIIQEPQKNDTPPDDELGVEVLDQIVGGSEPEPFPYHDSSDISLNFRTTPTGS